jgi:hypothetical protein
MQTPSTAPVVVTSRPDGQVIATAGGDPTAVWRGAQAQRNELRSQLNDLEGKRRDLARELERPRAASTEVAGKVGIEARITEVDKRISDVEKQLAAADAAVAKAAAVPGAVVEPPRYERRGPPEEVYVLSGMFIVIVMLPLSIAFARRIWKRGTAAVMAFPQELTDRLNRLDQAVDSIAIEVERIGEGQRFVTRVLAENGNRAIAANAALPLDVGARGEKSKIGREGERGTI